MPVILFLLFVAAVIWAIALAKTRVTVLEMKRMSPLHLGGVLVLLVGSVFGAEFFNISTITLDRLLLAYLVVVAGWAWLMERENLRRPNGMDLAVVGVIGILALSTVLHDFSYSEGLPLSRLIFFYCLPFALYMVVRTAKLNQLDLVLITTVLGGLAVYLALIAIAETRYFHAVIFPRFIVDSETTEFLGRGRGPFLNPVSNGLFLIAGFCSVCFWWPKSSKRVKLFVLAAAFLVAIGVYCTLTRSVWMSLFLIIGIGCWITTNTSQKGMLVVAGTIAAIVAVPVLGDKLVSFKRDKEVTIEQMSQSAQLRPLFLSVATRMFVDRPLFGCGFGQYGKEKYPYLQDAYSGQPLSKTKEYLQHNVFLAYLTETGIVGLSMLLLMLGVMARSAWLLWINRERPLEQRQFGLLLAAVLISYCVNGMFHDTSIIPMANYLLLFVAGIVNNIRTGSPFAASELAPATRVPTTPLPTRGYPAAN